MSVWRLVAAMFLMVVAGCSIKPLPEDVTGFDTVQIVSKVRCEVRDGIRSYVIGALRRPERSGPNPRYLELAEGLRDGTLKWRELRQHLKAYAVDKGVMTALNDITRLQ
jgi:hypothetical protein